MLSKVAERVYWTARYLERIESTARLISIYDKLLFDLPRSVHLSWYNLITINSLDQAFTERYEVRDERNVVKFLVCDDSNYSSIVSSLKAVRENVRTTRDVIPADVWYMINELNMYVQENMAQGINRSKRYDFLNKIIHGCQTILGTLYSDMPRDAAWEFLRIGRNLERADMTTRNIDAAVSAIIETELKGDTVNSHQIIWLNLLCSLNADHSYRRTLRESVKGRDVVEYLMSNKAFPKSVGYCLTSMANAGRKLPNATQVRDEIAAIKLAYTTNYSADDLGAGLRDYLNELQIRIIGMHQKISSTWFTA